MSMAYFAMAADLGWLAVEVEFARGPTSTLSGRKPRRQVFWVRHLSCTAPQHPGVPASLGLDQGHPGRRLLHLRRDPTGLGGAAIPSAYKWAYYFYGAIACVGIAYQIGYTGARAASAKGVRVRQKHVQCSLVLMMVWVGYGVAWALSEGGNVISPAEEGVFYGILDLMAGPGFCTLVALAARQVAPDGDEPGKATESSGSSTNEARAML
ncbi:hypothetical protein HIM_04961 [Hirsutella minnesotensis 3608]|uniref:Uncharacterized protein n=1 Tax=Hirsutella minnesotensis 3608 TaxID=1043627 RepID=A0A0F8A5R8_9HYPO|nr:hypothetical protein HIM_04961 [Hirsutella minnesotensis 3608]